jgi:alkaline phosphatase D
MTDTDWIRALSSATDRRGFLRQSAGFGAVWLGLDTLPSPRPQRLRAWPFTLGVASGDPWPDGAVLWTRLAPDPMAPGGGMPETPVEVRWEVAADEAFSRIAASGTAAARPEWAHSIHVELEGLEPDRVYWYRFIADGEASPVGRTRTMPLRDAAPDEIRFAFASCQHYEQGYFTALRHLSDEDVRFVVHLGDYIYEGSPVDDRPRRHATGEIVALDDYRRRYAQYRLDSDLQAAHAAAPWIVTWDDHEVDNNYAGALDQDDSPAAQFLLRRAAAYQAHWEHMPLRRSAVPTGPDGHVYRRFGAGTLIGMHVLDGRQYRSDQPCGDGTKAPCDGTYDPDATMLGAEQERWLMDGLSQSGARWNVLANQVPMSRLDNDPGQGERYSMDRWDGYVAARRRLTGFLHERRPSNPIVLTGDVHSNWVGELKADPEGNDSPGVDLRFFNGQRGYVRCSVTPEAWRSEYRVLEYVTRPGSPIATRATFIVENGVPAANAD